MVKKDQRQVRKDTDKLAGPVDCLATLPDEIVRYRVLTPKQTANMLGESEATTERKRKARTGPRWIRLSERRIGYRLSDILAWLDERAAESGEAA